VTYRDRALECPRCKTALARDAIRDAWDCVRCGGALVGVEEVIRELVRIAPDLAPASGRAVDLATPSRRSRGPFVDCVSCGLPMLPVYLGGVDVDRCVADQLLWFDAGEHRAVLDRADEQRRERSRSWLARLFSL
jgi:Zn-finger nucleic acid-binding protein